MAPKMRILGLAVAFAFVSACSSLPGRGQSPKGGMLAEVQAAQTKSASLEIEVSRLKSENARLANQLLDVQRKNDALASANSPDDDATEETVELAVVAPPQNPPITVSESPVNENAVVEGANSPELEQAGMPVAAAPRMVQSTFASTESVFENEANGDFSTASVLFGVHLASYRKIADARDGWRKLQRANPDELGLLEPRVETVTVPEKGVFLRLIGGGFSSDEKAAALCASLKEKGLFCSVSGFAGQQLPPDGAG